MYEAGDRGCGRDGGSGLPGWLCPGPHPQQREDAKVQNLEGYPCHVLGKEYFLLYLPINIKHRQGTKYLKNA